MSINELLNYIITNRTVKPNKNTVNVFKRYLESCEQDNISMDQIMNEFNNGLTVDVFESQVLDYFS
jgi:predicted metal-dependent TIM-barrel fold hydrolase